MPQIFDWSATRRERLTTVGGLRAARGRHGSFAQVTADTAVEAAAAEAAGAAVLVITGFQHNHVATRHPSARNYEALRASVEPDGSLRLAGAEAGVPEG